MWPHNLHPAPDLDLSLPELPPRSRLFGLAPAGRGTAQVEGLLSYLVRLARAHSVNPRRLIKTVFAEIQPLIARLRYASFFTRDAGTIDGLARYAEIFSETVAGLTSVAGTRFTTLLALRELLPANGAGLLVRRPKWCPACVEEMVRAGTDVYRPLLWSFELYSVCVTHHLRLAEVCPGCGKPQPFIPRFPDLGRCALCMAPLGVNPKPAESNVRHVASDGIERWVSGAIADIVEHLEELEATATRARFVVFVRTAVQYHADGNRAALCERSGLPRWVMAKWLSNDVSPSLPQLLSVCYVLSVLPSEIFLAGAPAAILVGRPLRKLPYKLFGRAERPLLTAAKRRRLEARLAKIVADAADTRPLSGVAKALGLSRSSLNYWFPAECDSIRAKHALARRCQTAARRQADCDAVTTVVRELVGRGEYPGKKRVDVALRTLGKPSVSLMRPELRDTWRQALVDELK